MPFQLRQAMRGLIRRPGFATVAILTLALGIGANTAIFSVAWHLLFAPLPFPAGDRMGYIWDSAESGFQVVPSGQQAAAFMEASRTLERIEPYSTKTLAWRGETATEVLEAGLITQTMPTTLGVSAVMGRTFLDSEVRANGPAVVLVSESFWRSRLGADAAVIGSTLRLDGQPWEIVGVVPDRMSRFRESGRPRDIWLPFVRDPEERANLLVVHREGVTAAEVGDELTAISANIPEAKLGAEQPVTRMRTPRDMLGTTTQRAIILLLAAVAVVLIIACANVAGLLLMRGADRRRELAICAALGADRPTILRNLLIEAILIALAGGALGLLIGAWGIDLIRSIRPTHLAELDVITLDNTVLAFTAIVTLLTVAIFGLLPSLRAARADLRTQFTATSGGSTGSPDISRAGASLVIAEVALAVVLLVAASLLTRTMIKLQSEPLGFDGSGIVRLMLDLPVDRYPDATSRIAFASQLREQLQALPGIDMASLSTGVPPELGIMFGQLSAEGVTTSSTDRLMSGAQVDSGYFRMLRIPLVEGRAFDGTEADAESIILNRTTADRFWPGESAIGKRVRIGTSDQAPWYTVIGVSADMSVSGPGSSLDRPQVFLPFGFSYPFITAAVRVRSGDVLALVPAIRAAVAHIDADLPVRELATIEQMLAESVGRQRFNMLLFGSFAALALVLATVGLYGVIAFNVSRRTRELGIRSALGATPHGVRRMVLRHGAVLAASGAVTGGLVAFQLTRLMEGMLHEVAPRDPLSFAAALALVFSVSMIATWLPARRASRVDPLVALRSE